MPVVITEKCDQTLVEVYTCPPAGGGFGASYIGVNVGDGEEVYKETDQTTNPREHRFRTLVPAPGSTITVTQVDDVVEIGGGGGSLDYATCEEADAGVDTVKVINPETGACSYDRKRVAGQHEAGKGTEVVTLLPDTGVLTIDCLLSNVFDVVLHSDIVVANPVNPIGGQTVIVYFRQDITGGWNATFGDQWTFVNQVDPQLTPDPSVTDLLSCAWDTHLLKMRATLLPNFGAGGTGPIGSSDLTFSNVGGGAEVLQGQDGEDITFRTITGSGDIVVTENADTIDIALTVSGEISLAFVDLTDVDMTGVVSGDLLQYVDGMVVPYPVGAVDTSAQTYITVDDETDVLPNSRMIVAGSGVDLDYGTPGEVAISLDTTSALLGTQAGCIVTRAATQTLATAGTEYPISFDTEVLDEDGFWSSGAPTRITIPATGWYVVVGSIQFAAAGSDATTLRLGKNGAAKADTDAASRDGITAAILSFNQVSETNFYTAGDYIELLVTCRTGTNNTVYGRLAITRYAGIGPQGIQGDTGPASFPDAPTDGIGYVRKNAAWAPESTDTGTSGNFLVNGGGVAWVSGLTFLVSAAIYVIQGVTYNSPETSITLDAADATNPRIDSIAVNISNTVVKITGTPAVNPERPDIDPTTQLELSFVYVPATATVPNVTVTPIYRENTEWTTSRSGTTFTLASTNNPYAGTVDIEGTLVATNHYVNFASPVNFDPNTKDKLVFYIRSKGTWPSTRVLNLTFRSSGGAQRGNTIGLRHGSYGFDSSIASTYQQIVIPVPDFGAGGNTVTSLRMTMGGTGATVGMYLDNIEFQTGNSTGTVNTNMRWRGDWDSTVAYVANDTVLYGTPGVQYVCTIANTGQTPSTSSAYWQDSSSGGSTETLPVTIIDAKGDLIVGTAADTAARFAVGADGTVPIADSTQTAGMRWGSVSASPGGSDTYLQYNDGGVFGGDAAMVFDDTKKRASFGNNTVTVAQPPVSIVQTFNTATKSITTLTSVTTTATATVTAHGYSTGDRVLIAGASPAAYNGTFNITVTGVDTFTYPFAGGTSPATGTKTAHVYANAFAISLTDTASYLSAGFLDFRTANLSRSWMDKKGNLTVLGINTATPTGSGDVTSVNIGSATNTIVVDGSGLKIYNYGVVCAGAYGPATGFFIGTAYSSGATLQSPGFNILEQRYTTNPQTFRLYNTYTDATTNERAKLEWSSNVFRIGTEKGSVGGTARAMDIQTDGTTRATWGAAGGLSFAASNTLTFGSFTVAGLGAAGTVGRTAYVTDGAASLANGATVTGGGSTKYLVWDNGTNWIIIGGGSAGSSSPTTTEGDLIVRGASIDQRLAISTTDLALVVDTTVSGKVKWAGIGIRQNAQSGNYTIAAVDNGASIDHLTGAGAGDVITIDSNTNLALPIGFTFSVFNEDSNSVQVSITTDNLYWSPNGTTGSRTIAQYGFFTFRKFATTKWHCFGVGGT